MGLVRVLDHRGESSTRSYDGSASKLGGKRGWEWGEWLRLGDVRLLSLLYLLLLWLLSLIFSTIPAPCIFGN
jgi:hypothetical protein